ncbi:MAG: metal-dependent hydrolase [Myxococcota bacterium]|nr:metal-dependent hydrolase [Myxococcota bacterium]
MDTITVRRMPFDFSDGIDSILIPGEPELSYRLIAGSLLLPYLEPYLIRSMRAARDRVTDAEVLKGLEAFCAQEGQHYRMHAKFNEACRLEGFPGLADLEKELKDDYQRFSSQKSLRFNLAYAEGFEAFTMNLVHFVLQNPGFNHPESTIAQLWEWHFIEELEHRTVTFDVYEHVVGGYFYRLFVGIYAQWHFTRWLRKVNRYMLKASPPPKRTRADQKARRAASRSARQDSLRKLLPPLLRTYLPHYTPHAVKISPEMQVIADRYTRMATHHS